MTFYEFGKKQLIDRGMFDSQAEAVMNMVTEDSKNPGSANEPMKDRWHDDIEGYPAPMKAMTFIAIRPIAVKYIKENIPQAWFRPMFDDEHPLAKEFKAMQK